MRAKRCLYCYQPLDAGMNDFHPACSQLFFGSPIPPLLDYSYSEMKDLAREIAIKSIAVTGVQAKLSLTIEKKSKDPKGGRFTIVGLWGGYILKPPTAEFPYLPANEDLTMHLATHFGITTALHSLIRLKSGELAYITKRFDRVGVDKLALEDLCQLSGTLTEDKYRSSMEKVGKYITKFSSRAGLDALTFFETTLLSYLTGNADMHLKNFSLLTTTKNEIILSPAYDLVCTKIVMPNDKEETALTINGRKSKLRKTDFDALATNLQISDKARDNSYARFARSLKEAQRWIAISFLPAKMKDEYKKLLTANARKLQLV
ncbi:MAG TPA: HipA domain-containing protein [Chryseolinea sp.]|nr:HipA domain-containing protein [Chryseolinea sp.]